MPAAAGSGPALQCGPWLKSAYPGPGGRLGNAAGRSGRREPAGPPVATVPDPKRPPASAGGDADGARLGSRRAAAGLKQIFGDGGCSQRPPPPPPAKGPRAGETGRRGKPRAQEPQGRRHRIRCARVSGPAMLARA